MAGVLLITHDHIGQTMLDAVEQTFGQLTLPARALAIYPDSDPEACLKKAEAFLKEMNSPDGYLIFSDIFGATPGNIAQKLASPERIVISGVSLPMLFRIFNYPELPAMELAQKAIAAGHDGIVFAT